MRQIKEQVPRRISIQQNEIFESFQCLVRTFLQTVTISSVNQAECLLEYQHLIRQYKYSSLSICLWIQTPSLMF